MVVSIEEVGKKCKEICELLGGTRIRKSMVEGYRFCPTYFKKVFIDCVEEDENFQVNLLKINEGKKFHEYADKFFDICEGFKPDDWIKIYDNDESLNERERDMLLWFLDMERQRYEFLSANNMLERFRPIARELHIINEGYGMEGTIDRVDEINENTYAIIEYKTGHKKINKTEFAFYKCLWELTYENSSVEYCVLINPRKKKVEIVEITNRNISSLYKVLCSMEKSIRSGKFEKDCTDAKYPYCQLCDYEEVVEVVD